MLNKRLSSRLPSEASRAQGWCTWKVAFWLSSCRSGHPVRVAVFSFPLRPCPFPTHSGDCYVAHSSLSHPESSHNAVFTVSHMQWLRPLTLCPKWFSFLTGLGCFAPTRLSGEKRDVADPLDTDVRVLRTSHRDWLS